VQETTVVAHRDELGPGQMLYVVVDGLPIALANVDGQIYAFGDACRHEGGSLSSGILRDDTVTCPWHGWVYNVRTGKAIVPPVGLRVPTYPVVLDNDDVAIVIDWPDG
jgi:nitrite reductase/ring-hydroxylating ferredoxin subunit